ncbi:MAG: ankyrin repeat domain-containing protein [Sideroxyarcus sp.]|nr:ankyrin repeat domain-containing protein [Sideroxyarcus sp.]
MRQYRIFEHPSGEVEVIKKGWSWLAFFFPWLWALINRLWLVASAIFILSFMTFAFGNLITRDAPLIITLFMSLYFGAFGHDWLRGSLEKKGFTYMGALKGASAAEVTSTYIENVFPEKFAMTPLMVAASKGDIQQVMKILASGVDVNSTDNRGATALMYAAINGQLEVVKTLLEVGVNPSLKTALGLTALDYAKRGNQEEIARLLAV